MARPTAASLTPWSERASRPALASAPKKASTACALAKAMVRACDQRPSALLMSAKRGTIVSGATRTTSMSSRATSSSFVVSSEDAAAPLEPADPFAQAHHFADDGERRRLDGGGARALADVAYGADDDALARGGAALDDGDRLGRRAAGGDEALHDGAEARHAHVEHERRRRSRQLRPGDRARLLFVGLVTGGEGDGAGEATMRERDAGVGWGGDGGGDAGDDVERHAGVDERFGLFAAAAEDERIAALQAHDDLPAARALDEERIELLLIEAIASRGTRDQLGGGRRVARDDLIGDQSIGDDHLGAMERFDRAHGDEPGIARAGADEIHKTCHFLGIPSA